VPTILLPLLFYVYDHCTSLWSHLLLFSSIRKKNDENEDLMQRFYGLGEVL
jgi:hypothetical protein